MVTQENDQRFIQIYEGRTKILVPAKSIVSVVPSKTPAFFNRLAKLNRDISILAYRVYALGLQDSMRRRHRQDNSVFWTGCDAETITFADAFSGTGARALRVAVEAPEIQEIYGNDINGLAIENARLSAELNSVGYKCFFRSDDVHKFLTEHKTNDGKRFVIADLDPFGSPSPYIDSLLRSVRNGGLISVTATDTAVLCGVYPKICLRKYYGRPINNSFSNETAIRLLLSLISLVAARFELIIEPVFVHANFHYLRVYLTIKTSSSKANMMHEKLGFIQYCFKCGNRKYSPLNPLTSQFGVSRELCNQCGDSLYTVGGPMWSGQLFDKQFVRKMNDLNSSTSRNDRSNVVSCDRADVQRKDGEPRLRKPNNLGLFKGSHKKGGVDPISKILEVAITELDSIPYYFRSDEISSMLRKNPLPLGTIIERLVSNGFNASRTSLNPGAFKTDARLSEIIGILK
ncbi:MAG: hypothetical protein WBP64_13465 [Nitrososphaeraceae archaeon]